ncbi:protein of unknown function [Cupriavidus neocaledonicus]|uniref:Uncharacterized protein n=1 Tax=Cupriavidus neocaledonicus TaxID=1040979 RepID=A0A375H8H1_9BURK|nr:protein of unknown function [Cupriavidus neocaledonicus]
MVAGRRQQNRGCVLGAGQLAYPAGGLSQWTRLAGQVAGCSPARVQRSYFT